MYVEVKRAHLFENEYCGILQSKSHCDVYQRIQIMLYCLLNKMQITTFMLLCMHTVGNIHCL